MTQFLPRDAMRKHGPCCRPLSVCTSAALVYCIHTAKDIVKLLSRSGIVIIVAFDPSAGTKFQGKLVQRRTQNTRG